MTYRFYFSDSLINIDSGAKSDGEEHNLKDNYSELVIEFLGIGSLFYFKMLMILFPLSRENTDGP